MEKQLKIGVFGVSDPEMKNKTTPSNVEGLDFQDAVAYARKEAAALKAEGCDVVIALSHTLDPKSVAAQVDGVDLWLCGHEHIELSESVTTPDGSTTYVSESGYYLNTVGLIDLNCTMDEDGSVHVDYNKTSVDYEAAQNYPKEASVTAVLDSIKAGKRDSTESCHRYFTGGIRWYLGTYPYWTDKSWKCHNGCVPACHRG